MFSHVLGDEVLAVVHAESDDRDRGGRVFTSFVLLVRGFVQSQDEGEGGVVLDHRDGGRNRVRANHVRRGRAEVRMEGAVCRERGAGGVFRVFDVDVSR